MLKRISKLQKPTLKNDEEYQRVQMAGTSRLLKEMMMATIKAANKLGALDQSVYSYDEKAEADIISDDFFRAMERETQDDASELGRLIMGGMQSTAINYAGLVLTGKMDPIYDASLDDEQSRKETRLAAEKICSSAGVELASLGALRETDKGTMVIMDKYRLFDTIKGVNYGKAGLKRKTKQCVKCAEQSSKHKTTNTD